MATDDGRLEGVSVLIVDDDPDIRDSVEAMFRSEGADTITCGDGNSAVRLSLEKKPRLVILDMMLPGRSGFLVLERIKGYSNSPLVIMITANEGKRHEVFAKGLGAEAYLQKPVSLGQLIDAATRLIDEDDQQRAAAGDDFDDKDESEVVSDNDVTVNDDTPEPEAKPKRKPRAKTKKKVTKTNAKAKPAKDIED